MSNARENESCSDCTGAADYMSRADYSSRSKPAWRFIVIQYVAILTSLLVPSAEVDSRACDGSTVVAVCQDACTATEEGSESGGGVVSGPAGLPLCAILETTSLCVRTPGRRSRTVPPTSTATPDALLKRGQARAALTKWVFAVLLSVCALVIAPSRAKAGQHPPAATVTSNETNAAADEDATAMGDAAPVPRTVSHRRRKQQDDQPEGNGNGFPRRPFVGMTNVVVNDPATYPRPECLENDNPNSFWYSMRPNIFNVPVEAEWDFYNLINTDRPDFTDAVYSVGKGVTYLENGFTYTKIDTFDTHINTRQVPESLLRHGLTDEFELRLKWPGYLMENVIDPHSTLRQSTFGSEDIDTAFKWEILQQQGWRPMTTLVAGMTLPTGSPGTSANYVQPHFNLLAGWGFRRWFYLKWQTGCDFVHTNTTQVVTPLAGASTPTFIAVRSPPNSWHESISLLTQWTKRVGAFHEWFMISGTGGGDTRAQHFLDMGLYLYATPNVQFDLRVGRQISNRVDYFFTGAGFSGRW